mmetsp:Transcript_43103/g.131279  ORF Transcript_43103/g.131279 Transcript_43103/m.131279 type:complete len:407 (+) Transcript_43103:213-1433(+)
MRCDDAGSHKRACTFARKFRRRASSSRPELHGAAGKGPLGQARLVAQIDPEPSRERARRVEVDAEDVPGLEPKSGADRLREALQSKRADQVEDSAEVVARALTRMSSLLEGAGVGADDDDDAGAPASVAMDLGREIAGAELASVRLHSQHRDCWNEWAYDLVPRQWKYEFEVLLLNEVDSCSETKPRTVNDALRPWLEDGDGGAAADEDSTGGSVSGDFLSIKALKELVALWLAHDREFCTLLDGTSAALREAMNRKDAPVAAARGELASAREKLDEVRGDTCATTRGTPSGSSPNSASRTAERMTTERRRGSLGAGIRSGPDGGGETSRRTLRLGAAEARETLLRPSCSRSIPLRCAAIWRQKWKRWSVCRVCMMKENMSGTKGNCFAAGGGDYFGRFFNNVSMQ